MQVFNQSTDKESCQCLYCRFSCAASLVKINSQLFAFFKAENKNEKSGKFRLRFPFKGAVV
jgi:hypothetical protein